MIMQSSHNLRDAIPFRNQDLNENELLQLEKLGFSYKCYPNNTTIKASQDDMFIVVHRGWGCLYSNILEGDRQILDFPLNGDLLLLSRTENGMDETLISLTELMVWQAPVRSVMARAINVPRLLSLVISASIRHKSILVQHLNSVGRRKALPRVAHLLLELGKRLEMVGAANKEGFRCPLTQYDLADALGLTAIHVNRMLRELREREFIDFRQKTVRFLDKAGLERLAGFEADYLRIDHLN